jgi:FAD/FMN-containing dehydrogenase
LQDRESSTVKRDRRHYDCNASTGAGAISSCSVSNLMRGGMGWLTRKFGLSVDNLVSADVVTADGRVLRASPDSHPDLLWALRGGGGNFGGPCGVPEVGLFS